MSKKYNKVFLIVFAILYILSTNFILGKEIKKNIKIEKKSLLTENNYVQNKSDPLNISGKVFNAIQKCTQELGLKAEELSAYNISVEEESNYYVIAVTKIKIEPSLGGGDPIFYLWKDSLEIFKRLRQK